MAYNFKKVGDWRFDPALVKGWFLEDKDLFEDDDEDTELVRQLTVLYDCYQLTFDDEDGKLEDWLDNALMKNFVKRSQ